MNSAEYEELKGVVRATALIYYPSVKACAELTDIEQEIWCRILLNIQKKRVDSGASLVTFLFPHMHSAAQRFAKKLRKVNRIVVVENPLSSSGEDDGENKNGDLYNRIGVDPIQESQTDL